MICKQIICREFLFLNELELICLQEQFEEYVWDNHIGARVWHDQPTDQIRPLWLLI